MIVPAPRMLLAAAVVIPPAATVAGIVPGLAIPCAGIVVAAILVAAVDAVRARERAGAIQARAPEVVRVTKDTPAALAITWESRLAQAVSLRAGIVMPEGVSSEKITEQVNLPPGKSALAWPCTGVRRGDHDLTELHLETPSPLGLWLARDRRAVACHIRVYPNLRDRETAALFLGTAQAGLRLARQAGKGREFERLRDYAPGDSYEDIYWKATARRGKPVVKLYQLEHAQEVYAVIDASRLSARDNVIESYVTAALHLALAAERQGDRFGLITFSDRAHCLVRAHHGMDHFRLCRETIYNLHPRRVSPDFREVFTSIQLNLRRRALLVFLTSLDDPLVAETFEREVGILSRRHVVLIVSAAKSHDLPFASAPESLESVYSALAGQIVWNKMRQLQISLGNRGVRLFLVDPSQIKRRVATAYFDVKRRQAL
jgi:uncharacterized protein (DUF58 family)